jgi:predicted alpha-1,2-mannosidase
MTSRPFYFLLSAFCFLLSTSHSSAQTNPAQYVDPFIGTGGHGHTYPGATLPFGMVQLSPDTRTDQSWDGCGGYHQSDSLIYGFTHTHLSGTGCSDYGDILLMPTVGKPVYENKKYASRFSHQKEKASPGYYSVHLDNPNVDVELTTTLRTGLHKYTFPKTDQANIILDLAHRDKVLESSVQIVNETTVEGMRRSENWARNQVIYFVIQFSKPFLAADFYLDSLKITLRGASGITQQSTKTNFSFKTLAGESIYVKVGISGVSIEGARKNLEAELPGWDFQKTKLDAESAWNKELSKITVSGGTSDQLKTFYTALYHCMVVPNIYNDVDGKYLGRDFKIHTTDGFNYYTVFSLWDTFRAWHPLMTIIDRKRTLDYIKTFLTQYDEGGLLPVWEFASNETECMIGYHSVPVIVDAAVKGIRNFDMQKSLSAMKKSAESIDRYGLGKYMDHGFLSMEDEGESVSKTLEYSYDDWCIAQMASINDQKDDFINYVHRAQYWKNLFDTETGFIRPKKNGNWLSPFDPREVNNNYTEANAWQYTFFVPQDVTGLINKMGGKEKFEKKLDELFSATTQTTGREQSDITGLIGQYAHGNEPSHHMAYLYNYIGKPWKTQEKIHRITSEFYHAQPDGLIGNEDCGQMSAWYILSAMGIYQVTPGSPVFAIGTPLFKEAKINLETIVPDGNGKSFSITATNISDKNFYIQSASLNGTPYNKSYITYNDIMNGGELIFTMGDKPNQKWGSKEDDYPVAEIKEHKIIPVPIIKSEGKTFKGKTRITLQSSEPGLKLFYMLTGPFEKPAIIPYTSPVEIDTTSTIYAFAKNDADEKSLITKGTFYKNPHPDWKIIINSEYAPDYSAGGNEATIDGIRGETNWRKGEWQGYTGKDFEVIIDLGKTQEIKKLGAGFLQDSRAWILFPTKVEFEISTDGKNFTKMLTIPNTIPDKDYKVQVRDFMETISPQKAQYVKVRATNYGKLPEWHQGYEDKGTAWLFVDEIFVEN